MKPKKSLYNIPPGCICMGDGLYGMRCDAEEHATRIMNRYWLSWNQPTEDYRPLNDPPTENTLGWWCSGTGNDGASICAMVLGVDEEDAWKTIRIDWPEATEDTIRFTETSREVFPGSRFLITDGWMRNRLEAEQKRVDNDRTHNG